MTLAWHCDHPECRAWAKITKDVYPSGWQSANVLTIGADSGERTTHLCPTHRVEPQP